MLRKGDRLKCVKLIEGASMIGDYTIGDYYEIVLINHEDGFLNIDDSDNNPKRFTIESDDNGLSWKTFFSAREVKLKQLLDY